MTPEERNMLNDLANNVAQAPAPQRDAEAEDLIRTKIGKRPDALYLMTQTVLIQNMALQRLQQQVRDLQSRSGQQVSTGGSFLGGPSGSAGYAQAPPSSQPQYAQAAPQYAPSQYAPQGSGGGSSFLRGAAQTAAGVAAGTLAAEAIGSMFSPHAGGLLGGGGSGFMGGAGGAPTEEIVNNYYDSPGDSRADDAGSNNFVDPGDVNASDDSASYDDSAQYDDASADDSGFDNSGDDGSFLS